MSSLLTREALIASRTQAASLVGVGILVWFVATLALRIAGHVLLPPDDPSRVAFVYAATVPLMAMLAFAVYSLLDVPPTRRLTAATLLVLPGMVLDAALLTSFESIFPQMAPSAGPSIAGVLLLAYAAVLLTGVVPLTYVRQEATDSTEETTTTTEQSAESTKGESAGEN